MKNLVKIGLVTFGLFTVLNADDIGILGKIKENLNPLQYMKKLQIGDGTEFKIADDEEVVIVNGTVKCYEKGNFLIDGDINRMCTDFKNKDNFKFKVALVHLDKLNKVITEPIFEEWTVKKSDEKIQLLRPNGFSVQLLKKVQ